MLAVIREAECIGCTKCIDACPADAILGSAKWMHTVIADECIGCQLCIAPCPVDCIDMVPIAEQSKSTRQEKAAHFRGRYHARRERLQQNQTGKTNSENLFSDKKAYILAAMERVKSKKS